MKKFSLVFTVVCVLVVGVQAHAANFENYGFESGTKDTYGFTTTVGSNSWWSVTRLSAYSGYYGAELHYLSDATGQFSNGLGQTVFRTPLAKGRYTAFAMVCSPYADSAQVDIYAFGLYSPSVRRSYVVGRTWTPVMVDLTIENDGERATADVYFAGAGTYYVDNFDLYQAATPVRTTSWGRIKAQYR